ncbi:hypothetical protein [Bacillus sp. FJAT-27445]|uniref:hypothetical protein n=1 Tax=Bacillus sp. FJAT-27445 TaxID=1679166 RepID=UPI00074438B0|nr:hypothetical protein [Bacillus sp. FJAT-27445]
MNQFKKVMVAGILIGGLLSGCASSGEVSGGKSEEPKKEATKADQKPLKKDSEGNYILEEVGQIAPNEDATGELLGIAKVNQVVDIAPLKVTVKDIKLIKLSDVSEDMAVSLSMYTGGDYEDLQKGFSYIQVQYETENTSEGNVSWNDLETAVTDAGEQIDVSMEDFHFDDAESDSMFIGKVKKEFIDSFIVKNDQINKVKLVFGASSNSDTYDTFTDNQTVEYELER